MKASKSDIANINTDSLYKNKSIEDPVITDLNIEGITYKVFLLPFKMQTDLSQIFVLAAIIPLSTYQDQSQSIPVYMLLSVCFVLIGFAGGLAFFKNIFFKRRRKYKH